MILQNQTNKESQRKSLYNNAIMGFLIQELPDISEDKYIDILCFKYNGFDIQQKFKKHGWNIVSYDTMGEEILLAWLYYAKETGVWNEYNMRIRLVKKAPNCLQKIRKLIYGAYEW